MFKDNDTENVICHLYPEENSYGYREYGLLVCDLVRHVASCFSVDQKEVWEWVDRERIKPTTDITSSRQKPN
jgi:hypothetical protein